MSLGDLIALVFILVIFGGASGLFVYVATRLMAHRAKDAGFFVEKR